MPPIRDIFVSGQPLQVDLLTAMPDFADPALFSLPRWQGYGPQFGVPSIQWNDDGVLGSITVQWIVPQGATDQIVAAAVSYNGQVVLICNCSIVTPVIGKTSTCVVNFIYFPVEH